MDHSNEAVELFVRGYSCSQAVAMAFCDLTGLDEKTTARMVETAARIMDDFIREHPIGM